MKSVTHNGNTVTMPETDIYISNALKSGVPYSHIASITGKSLAALRTAKCRLNKQKTQDSPALHDITPVSESVTPVTVPEQNVTGVTPEPQPATNPRFTGWQLEAVYYVTCLTACYGFCLAMPGVIGYAFAVVYGLLSFAALQMVKDGSIPKTAEYGRNMVYALEVFACVFAHYYTINRALWANLKALPFEVAYVPKGGTWFYNNGIAENGYWQNGETVFYLACILSIILSVLAVVSIALRLELTKETNEKTRRYQ